jgi:hypothetical protein
VTLHERSDQTVTNAAYTDTLTGTNGTIALRGDPTEDAFSIPYTVSGLSFKQTSPSSCGTIETIGTNGRFIGAPDIFRVQYAPSGAYQGSIDFGSAYANLDETEHNFGLNGNGECVQETNTYPAESIPVACEPSTEHEAVADLSHISGSCTEEAATAQSEYRSTILWDLTLSPSADSDSDGLSDLEELDRYHTDPVSSDTDGDGYPDPIEIAAGTDPLDPLSFPGSDDGHESPGPGGHEATSPGGNPGPGGSPPAPPPREEAPKPVTGDLVLDCGHAKFEYFDIVHESTGIGKGDDVCAILVSNSVAEEMLSEATGGFSALSGVFMAYFLKYYEMHFAHLTEVAADAYVRHYVKKKLQPVNLGSTLIKSLFPDLEDSFAKTNAFVSIGKAVALTAIPIAAVFEEEQIEEDDACVGFLTDLSPSRISVGGTLAYNPSHVVDIADDGYLTRVSVYERHQRRLRPDQFVRKNFSLTCDSAGLAERDTPRDNSDLLSGATISVIK